ncbi:MAG TPA: ABC transporter permease, partial [Gammaproteobacteria bacterium]|nr:ABC transporter permease [Gammaproteobacteria bacterium]
MLRHYVALALRNTARTKLYAAISVIGLAIGFGAATLIGLYVHDELSYELFIPNYERIYQVSAGLSTGTPTNAAPSDLGVWLASDYPQFEAVTRLFVDGGFFQGGDRADFKANETIVWADANVFQVFRLPVVAGTLDGALDRPDALVLSRRTAQKYFGKAESAVGRTLLYNGMEPMIVTAVIDDLPSQTHLNPLTVIAAGHAPFSAAALQDRTPITVFGSKLWNSRTYALLKPNEPIAQIRESLKTLLDRHTPTVLGGRRKASEVWALIARPIAAIHLSSNTIADPDGERHGSLYTVGAIGLLILLIASINFVNLLTALGARRALEVGVRKALGAQRGDLFVQFMTESYLYVGLGAVLGLGLAVLALKPLNAFIGRTIDLSMFADWRVAAGSLLFLAGVAFLAGFYPALVLSAYRPATVTKGGRAARGQAGVRQILVVLQFATLIGLLIATVVTYQQMKFGMREALRQNTDPVVVLQGSCNEAL